MEDRPADPHCGRLDEHDPHPWTTPQSRRLSQWHECPGPPVIEGGHGTTE